MHDTGNVRRVDDLGRIVIPVELRRSLDINPKDSMDIYVEGERVILVKHKDACSLCGEAEEDMTMVRADRLVCRDCIERVKNIG